MREFVMSQYMTKESFYKSKSEYYMLIVEQMKNCFNCQNHDGFVNGENCICDDCCSGDVDDYSKWELYERPEMLNALKRFKDEFPNFYKFCVNISRQTGLAKGTYNSMDFDDNSSYQYNVYISVHNSQIVAIGEERWRDGGWYWFSKNKP